jgi:acetyl-CoA C-acetyltransferase
MKINIGGHYTTKTGELWDRSLRDLLKEAIDGVIKNSGMKPETIEAVFVSNKAAGSFENQLHLGALASQMISGNPPAMRIEGACASGGMAVVAAEMALMSGQYKTVLVVGVEKMTDVSAEKTTQILSAAADYTTQRGSTFPGLYAMLAQAHMREFGTTRDDLSAVAQKNHLHALDNPNAHFHKEFSLEQINKSVPVADPLRLLDCSPISDGAAALVLTTKNLKNKTKILGFGQGQDSLDLAGREKLTELKATKTAAKKAYNMAKIKAEQIEVAEVHDCFTIAEIMAIEDLEFFAKGAGGKATSAGKTTHNGKIVINPSGGLKASGHPVGATGIKQIAYLAKLIENNKFKLGLAHNVGGSGATAVVHILGK